MYDIVKNVVFILLIAALGYSVYFSIKYRRQTDARLRGMYQAKQNIAMGLMLVMLAVYPLYLIPGTNLSVTIGIIFLLIGLFNLFAGFRNQSIYRSKRR